MGRIRDAPSPGALKDLGVMVRHDHLGPEMSVYYAVVNLDGVVDDCDHMQVRKLWKRDIHRCPHYILDQNSAVL
jgi:hypothetical protein